jgi:uncharacterized membrane protein YeaQ/YmgE (transglycosylase-associated protein family)
MENLLIAVLVGLVAGFLASHLVSGHGYGLLGDIVVGILGAVVGTLLLGGLITTYILAPLGLAAGSIVGAIIVAFIGAVLVLAIVRLVSSAGGGGYRRRRWL